MSAEVLFLILLGIIVVLLLAIWLRQHRNRIDSQYTLAHLPAFPDQCKLYFDESTRTPCRRCAAEPTPSWLRLRKRFLLYKDEQDILRVKKLTFVFSCERCGYRGLDNTRSVYE